MKDHRVRRLAAVLATVALSAVATAAAAQAPAPPTHGHADTAKSADSGSSPATEAFKAGSAQMMKDMDLPYSGDVDRDFVAHMIGHHQGAVSMAEVELKYGKDPAMRKLARDIIRAQQKEIAFMKKWQAQHAAK